MTELSNIDILKIKNAIPIDSFHGEIWVRCPYCNKPHEISNAPIKEGYIIIRCECGKVFKQR